MEPSSATKSSIGLVGLAVMGQASHGVERHYILLSSPVPPCPTMSDVSTDHTFVTQLSPHTAHSQNLALNVAEKGFNISVYNRSYEKTEAAVSRAQKEGTQGECTLINSQERTLDPGSPGRSALFARGPL